MWISKLRRLRGLPRGHGKLYPHLASQQPVELTSSAITRDKSQEG